MPEGAPCPSPRPHAECHGGVARPAEAPARRCRHAPSATELERSGAGGGTGPAAGTSRGAPGPAPGTALSNRCHPSQIPRRGLRRRCCPYRVFTLRPLSCVSLPAAHACRGPTETPDPGERLRTGVPARPLLVPREREGPRKEEPVRSRQAGSMRPGMRHGTRGGSAEPLLPDVGQRGASELAVIFFYYFFYFFYFFPPVVLRSNITLQVSD
ncbi:translation initiation factor IF-2-like [Vidua chalybeata]|uniref:translation initiation factor IF-2-like n=1 Tax=Vidua chalybeata TaxID=81927 RepID=UPI0023A7BF79|nr:translation initiation factor IF-2-like [Vidua chalybeata]